MLGFEDKWKTKSPDNNQEAIKALIKAKKNILSQQRQTGRTSRLINEYIESFFHEPMGTKILIKDHYRGIHFGIVDDAAPNRKEASRMADEMLFKKVIKRLKNEYPNVQYESEIKGHYIIRKTKTYTEQLEDEIKNLETLINN